jgi:hypothetical protein
MLPIKRILASLAMLIGLATHAPSYAQNAVVVGTCGTPPVTYPAGQLRQVTQSTAGNLCTSASASGTFTDDATGTTAGPVPGSASYSGLNIGGNIVGQTGVNPSGSVEAAQVDLASVAGVTAKTGAGTASGALRVTLPTDGTGVVGLIAGTAVIGHVIVDTAPTTAVTGTFWQATQPVSAASLPLPAGAATAAKQPALGTAGTPSADVLTIQGATTGTALPVVAGGNTYTNITTATTTTVKSGAGVLHTVCVNTLGTVASAAVVYDNTAASGTKIATLNTLALLGCQTYDVAFATGLTIVTTGTVAPDITISSR